MMERMSRVDGAFFSVVDLSSGVPAKISPLKWSVEPGIYQLRVGMAFLQLDEMTSTGTFSKTADRLLDWSLRRYEVFLPQNEGPEEVADHLPGYCYFLEGLLPFIEKRFECAQALQGGIARVEKELESTRQVLEQSATVAQLLRLRLLSDYVGMVELDLPAAEREAAAIPLFQMQTDDRRTNGAFSFGSRNRELIPHANALSTILCLQALRMWNDYKRGELRTTWTELI
jgi:hypothetical protein